MPPQSALGALWSSTDGSSIYQTYGQVSDTPPETPGTNQLSNFDIASNSWTASQISSAGHLEGVAEGAEALVPVGVNGQPTLFHFGGYVDKYAIPYQGKVNPLNRIL